MLNIESPHDPVIPLLWVNTQKKWKCVPTQKLAQKFLAALFITVKSGNNSHQLVNNK